MKIAGQSLIDEFIRNYPDAKAWFSVFREQVKKADWEKNTDIREIYGSASFVGNRCVVFNIKGNKYRMEVQVSYKTKIVRVRRIGTHADYDKWKF